MYQEVNQEYAKTSKRSVLVATSGCAYEDAGVVAVLVVFEFQNPMFGGNGEGWCAGKAGDDLQAWRFGGDLDGELVGCIPGGVGGARVGEDEFAAKVEEGAIPGEHVEVCRSLRPLEARAREGCGMLRVGNVGPTEFGELAESSVGDSFLDDRVAEAGEELKGRGLIVLLAHEQKRRVRREQQERGCEFARAGRDEGGEALAKGAVADLIVILDADDLRGQRDAGGRGSAGTALPELERLALKCVGLGEDAGEKRGIGEILIVALMLAGEQDMDGVVKVVTPDGIGGVSALRGGKNIARKVLVGFDGDEDGAALELRRSGERGRRFRRRCAAGESSWMVWTASRRRPSR